MLGGIRLANGERLSAAEAAYFDILVSYAEVEKPLPPKAALQGLDGFICPTNGKFRDYGPQPPLRRDAPAALC